MPARFENSVNSAGNETLSCPEPHKSLFENSVNSAGNETPVPSVALQISLRTLLILQVMKHGE